MEQGIVVIHNELHDKWLDWLTNTNVSVFGIHSAGGVKSAETLEELIDFVNSENGRKYIINFRKNGFKIEYEYHAMSWMLPRELWNQNPELFRKDQDGNRNPDVNLCPSSDKALEIISESAARLAKLLTSDTGKYYIWQDDVEGKRCHCEKCGGYNVSDQVLIMMNAVLQGLRSVYPDAKASYLAYFDTAVTLPSCIKPEKGIFLEFAPYKRNLRCPINGNDPSNIHQSNLLPALLDFFGKEDACILDYWIDNSLMSAYKRPSKKLIFEEDVFINDVKYYTSLGFDKITSFAGYLDDEYISNHGLPLVREYATALKQN